MSWTFKEFKRTSASQINSFNHCQKQWWMSRILKLPMQQKQAFIFGGVLHKVIERYLLADSAGRDRSTGQPVDLYPAGWDEILGEEWVDGQGYVETSTVVGRLDEYEMELIPLLVAEAIKKGVLQRRDGRLVEERFKATVIDGIEINGAIDQLIEPNEIDDHKSTKKWRYAKSREALEKDLQLLVYAKVALDRLRKKGSVIPREFIFRHNQYCKDPDVLIEKSTRTVVATITTATIDDRWQKEVVAVTREMVAAAKITSLPALPEPKTGSDACNDFGGCPFRPICGRQETIDDYTIRVNRLRQKQIELLASWSGEGEAMSSPFKGALETKAAIPPAQATIDPPRVNPPAPTAGGKLGAILGGTKPAVQEAPAAPAAAQAPPAVLSAPAVSEAAVVSPAPWAKDACNSCGKSPHRGWNTKGNPCRICLADPECSEAFAACQQAGPFAWGPKPEFVAAEPAPQSDAEAQETPPPTAAPKRGPGRPPKAKEEAAVQVAEAAPTPEQEPAPAPELPAGEKRGRKVKKFTLLVGCTPVRMEVGKLVNLEDTFALVRAKMTEETGKPWHEIDGFRRKDYFAVAAEKIAEDLGTAWCVACSSSGSIDFRCFVDELRVFASVVIQGVIG